MCYISYGSTPSLEPRQWFSVWSCNNSEVMYEAGSELDRKGITGDATSSRKELLRVTGRGHLRSSDGAAQNDCPFAKMVKSDRFRSDGNERAQSPLFKTMLMYNTIYVAARARESISFVS